MTHVSLRMIIPLAAAMALVGCGGDANEQSEADMKAGEQIDETPEDAAERAMKAAENTIDASAAAASEAGEAIGSAASDAAKSAEKQVRQIGAEADGDSE